MTSTAQGNSGLSHGWINRSLIASGKVEPHINVYGGEDRFWIGPEGGQFSIFFKKGVPFDLEHWFTPSCLDTEAFAVIRKTQDSVTCQRSLALTNYSGTRFDLEVTREIKLVPATRIWEKHGISPVPNVKTVSYASVNQIKNIGNKPWTREDGLLSIWILGMYNASPASTVIIPFVQGEESILGPAVNDDYFGKVPADRLLKGKGVLFFKADAKYRSKIGLTPQRARSVMGSYDAENRVLTLVEYSLKPGVTDYVNSQWKLQDQPFKGDAINSYNDGPSQPGGPQLGAFYELESSSPALALRTGEFAVHEHQTSHFEGSEKDLDKISQRILGVKLAEIKAAFGSGSKP
jgi:hypothetical protein